MTETPAQAPETLEAAEPVDKPTMQEIADSLTGYDEIGIERAFGVPLEKMSATTAARACGFVVVKRQGKTHDEAYAAVMETRAADLNEMFADPEPDEGDEPSTPAGNADSRPESRPPS